MNREAELKAPTRVRWSAWLGVMVILKNLLDKDGRESAAECMAALCNLDYARNVWHLLGKTIPMLYCPPLALVTPNSPWQQHKPRKRIPALWDGDTLTISRLEHNHPESGGGASGIPLIPPQSNEACESSERKADPRLDIIQMRLRTTSNIAGMTFGFLLVKEAAPTIPLWLNLLIASVLGWSLINLPMIVECLLLYFGSASSCDTRMTPNDQELSHAARDKRTL